MKKWLCALSICAVTGLGAFGFAGCGDGDTVASISIKTLPETSFSVGDIVTPTLSQGVFTVVYSNGKTSDLPMSAADLVYINYGDITTGNKFVVEANAQNVIVRYKGKTTSYNVQVSKKDLNLDYKKSYSVAYDGAEKNASDVLDFVLPDGVVIEKIEYRIHSDEDGAELRPYDATPCDVGVYDMRITINGGFVYNDLVIDDATFTVAKADFRFAQKSSATLKDIYVEYGTDFNIAKDWIIGDGDTLGEFADSLKNEFSGLASKIKYAYRPNNSQNFTMLETDDYGNYDISELVPGEYVLRAYAQNLDNFADFYSECDLTIATRKLIYGTDYTIEFVQGATSYTYTPTESLMDIKTEIATADPTTVKVRLNIVNDNIRSLLSGDLKVFYNYSAGDNANWGGSLSAMSEYGYYKVTITASFSDGICELDNNVFGIKLIEPSDATGE